MNSGSEVRASGRGRGNVTENPARTRPGHVRAEFLVALPRPRPLALTSEPEFMALARAVRAEIVDSD